MKLWINSDDWRKACKPKDTIYTVLIVDPLVRMILPPVAASGITPNQITLIRLGLGLFTGGLFWMGHGILGALGFLLWYFLDCIDGKLARLNDFASPFGDWLDRTTDRLGVGVILVGEGVYLQSIGQDTALVSCLLFLSIWLFGITNALMLRPIRQTFNLRSALHSSSGTGSCSPRTLYEKWKSWLERSRISSSMVDDVEWLHLAIVAGGITGASGYVNIAAILMAAQKLIESGMFMVRRYNLLINKQ